MHLKRIVTSLAVLNAAAGCAVPVSGSPSPVVVAVPPASPTTAYVLPPPQTVYVPPPVTRTVPPPATSATRTVVAYYDAINRHDYLAAWNLGGSVIAGKGGYAVYADGFATTAWDTLSVTGVDGGTVEVVLSALQTDGSP